MKKQEIAEYRKLRQIIYDFDSYSCSSFRDSIQLELCDLRYNLKKWFNDAVNYLGAEDSKACKVTCND